MSFVAGEKVICVDASLPANPWHRQHPLKWGGIYVVRRICPIDSTHVNIDSSARLWECRRFRPFERKAETDIGFAREILRDAAAPTPQLQTASASETSDDR